jgi:hypothetical protein
MLHNSAQFLLCMAGIKWRVPTLQCSRDRDIHHRPSSLCQIPPSTHRAKLPIHFGMSSCQSGNSQHSMREAAAYVTYTEHNDVRLTPLQRLSTLSFVKTEQCYVVTRGGFTLKVMKLKLQGPSLERAPSKTLGGSLAMP